MNSFKTSNYADMAAVQRAAEILMMINGETTTLEVKKFLRLEGFIAYQNQVSRLMDELAQSDLANWTYTCNGTYRSYGFCINMDFTLDPALPPFGYN